jgi:hypothetical protein
MPSSAEDLVACAERVLAERGIVSSGDQVVVLGGSDFIQVHRVA